MDFYRVCLVTHEQHELQHWLPRLYANKILVHNGPDGSGRPPESSLTLLKNIFITTWLKSHVINNNHDKNYCHTIVGASHPLLYLWSYQGSHCMTVI